MKKAVCLLLTLILMFSLAACGEKSRDYDVTLPEGKKAAIILTDENQYPEDGIAAYDLIKEYKDNLLIFQCGDSREIKAGDPDIVLNSVKAAQNEDVAAIIYDRATQFTDLAIAAAKEINPDLITITIEPEREQYEIDGIADVEFVTNWPLYSQDIVDTAKEQGAEYFVFLSFPAHSEKGLYLPAKMNIEKYCEEQGIKFVYKETQDPSSSGGVAFARTSAENAVAELYQTGEISGENVALFSTDSSVQRTLVEQTDKRGLIYVAPPYPTAYNGICEYFAVDYPDDIANVDEYVESLKQASAESGGRYSVINFPYASSVLKAAIYTAFDMINSPELRDDYYKYMDNAVERALDAADSKEFTAQTLDGYFGVVLCYVPAIEIIK